MFKGEYSHSLDAKGRIIMPAKFREILGEQFVATRGLDGCIFAYPNDKWDEIENIYDDMTFADKDARDFARFFFGGASDCEVDKQGRVLIPAVLREFAGLEKEVVLTGANNHIEIWSKERWSQANDFQNMEAIAEKMASRGLKI